MPAEGALSATTDAIVVDPVDGTAMTVADASSDVLAKVVFALQDRERKFKHWRGLAEAELIERLKRENRTRATVGEFEISFKAANSSSWDPDDTEAALRELVERGWISAAEAVGVVETRREVKRAKAKQLLDRLHGPARQVLERCCEWSQGPPRFSVTESIQLEAPREP
jgi:hypothetical protein